MLLILCVLPCRYEPLGMDSRNRSLTVYICSMHYRMEIQHYIRHHRKQAVSFAIVTFILGGIALGGIYQMKKDSADGRLFLWKLLSGRVNVTSMDRMRLEQCSGCLRTGAGELFCSRKLYGNGGTCGR